MAVERIEDPNLRAKSSIYFFRLFAAVLIVAVLVVWVAVGLVWMTAQNALIVSGIAVALWVVVALYRRATESKSGLRPEGGVPWDGDIGNPDDENPVNDKKEKK